MQEPIKIHLNDLPQCLRQIPKPPAKIFYQGEKSLLSLKYIGIVGAREASPWALEWMEHEIAPVLKKLNIGIVSGGARGVDQKAHWLAIRAGVPTLIVLPSGLKNKYPKTIITLEKNHNVGFLSEYEPDDEMKKYYFYDRNRIIAALSQWVLIVQAHRKSGTMITAQYATDFGVPVFSLPGHPLDLTMSGNNQLLFDGAQMVRDKNDLLQLLV